MRDGPKGEVARVTLLGGAGIQVNGTPLSGRAAHRHPIALLALLVAGRGRPLTRDKLIAYLWPDRDSESGRNLLKVSVHELRKVLGDAAIRSTGDQLSAEIDNISCDLTDFAEALAARDDRVASDTYGGPFLDGFFLKDAAEFERWSESERSHIAASHRSALERLAAQAHAAGDREGELRWRHQLADTDPYSIDAGERLVRALAGVGDAAGALRVAEAFAQRRRADLGIDDDAGIGALARSLVSAPAPAGTTAVQPPSGSTRGAAANEPAPAARVPDPGPRKPRGKSSSRPRAVAAIAAIAVVGLVLVLAGVWRSQSHSTAEPGVRAVSTPAKVAIAPFHVVGGDTAMGASQASLLALRFTGDVGPAAIDPGRVAAAWGRIGGSAAPSAGGERSAARSVGATEFMTGEIVTSADSVAVAARLYDVASGAPVASARVDALAGTSPATIADQLAIELLARGAGEPEDRVAGLLGRPIAAARSYLAGQVAYRAARYAVAESLYAVALSQDSTFGAAGLGLAMANSWTVINEHYGIGRDAALAHPGGMSARDREFAQAFFGPDPALGPPRPAPVYLSRWEDLVEKYPGWTEAWYQLGDRYYHYGSLSGLADADDRALTAFRRALSQDSTFAAPLHHLVELYASRGAAADLHDASDRYFGANPSVDRNASAIGWETAMALGDSAWLGRIRARFDSMPPEELTRIAWVTDANGWPRADAERAATIVNRDAGTASEHERALILAFTLATNAGQSRAAAQAAAALGAQFPDRPIDALWNLYAALFGDGDAAGAGEAAVTRLANFANAPASGDHVRRDQQQLAACLTGYWKVTRGDVAGGRSALARVRTDLRSEDNNFARRNAEVCLDMLSAATAVQTLAIDARGRVARLDSALLEERVPPHAILEAGTIASARLHAALGDTAAALVAARRREYLTGDPLFLSTELREEARFASALGQGDEAKRALAHLGRLRRH